MLDWNDLKLFLAVARAGSTLGAARALGLNQTTVSRRMGALEHALGLTLFQRRSTGYQLTEAGRVVAGAAETVEAAVRATEGEAGRIARIASGVVRITAPNVVFEHLLAPIVVAYHARNPRVSVEQISSESHLDLAAGEADIAFRATEGAVPPHLVGRRLPDFAWTVYCSRGYAEAHGAPGSPEALAGHAMVAYDGALGLRNAWLVARAGGIVARSGTVPDMRAMLRAGIGVGLLPCIDGDREAQLLRCFAPPPEISGHWWLLTTPEAQATPLVRDFADFAATRLRAQRRLLRGEPVAPAGPAAKHG